MVEYRINNNIVADKVLLVYEDKKEEMSLDEALEVADREGLDLVMVGGDESLAVCKLMDYSKYIYNRHKIEKKNKKNNKCNKGIKEIRLNSTIALNDLHVKVNNIKRLLLEGYRVRVCIIYNGRLADNKDNKLVDKIFNELEVGSLDGDIVIDNNVVQFNIKLNKPNAK
ncbi:MAG: translation initiation factor IF-3 [Candidatus Anstonellales archaeon]